MIAPNQPPMPGYGPAVVTTQPVPGTGMGYIGPPGLEYLAMIDHLLIKQQVELLEAFTGWESCNKYKIMNNLGQDVLTGKYIILTEILHICDKEVDVGATMRDGASKPDLVGRVIISSCG